MSKPLVDGNYLIYKNKPLVRNNNFIIYGDMTDKYFLQLVILDEKNDEKGNLVPDHIIIQIIKQENNSITKQDFSQGLYESLELGTIWLNKYNSQS